MSSGGLGAGLRQASRRGAGPDTYANRMREWARDVTVYWRREYRKGSSSKYYVYAGMVGVFATLWKLNTAFIIPWQEERQRQGSGVVSVRVPVQPEHEEKWKVHSRTPLRKALDEKGTQFKSPEEILPASSHYFERPKKEKDVPSEDPKTPSNYTVLTLREYDRERESDVFIRTMYKLKAPDPNAPVPNSDEVRKNLDSPTNLSTWGERLIRSQVKCKAITPTDSCVPTNDVMLESVRKMMLALGPMYLLRHPGDSALPRRFSKFVEVKNLDLLMVGMSDGGSLATWLNRQFPHFKLDIVEPDGGLIRAARTFMGFQERDGITLSIDDPQQYLRRRVLTKKKYHGIFVDMLDENGNIPLNMCKLETLTNLRESMNDRAVAVVRVPNHDERRMAAVVQNWRMAFDARTVLLIHCRTEPFTLLMTFNDIGEKGMPKFGFASSVEDFRQNLRGVMHETTRRFNVDLLAEVDEKNYQQLLPGRKYTFKRSRGGTQGASSTGGPQEVGNIV